MRKRHVKMKTGYVIVILLVFCFGHVFAAPCGDVNSSGAIDIVDALLIAQFYVGLNPSNFDQSAADVNGDGGIDIVDGLLIAQYYVGLVASLPGCDQTPGPTDPLTTVTLQAEDGVYNDGIVETEYPGYTGSGYLNTTNVAGAYVEWTINLSQGGDTGWTFTYANGGTASRSMSVSVNGSPVISSLDFPVTSWETWSTVYTVISLNSGTNIIRLTSLSDDGAPNLDRADVSGSGAISVVTPTPAPTAVPGSIFGNVPIGFATLNGGTTGGQGGQTITVTTYSDLMSYAESSTPYIIMVQGTISNGNGGGRIRVGSNKSVIGVGSTAFLQGVGIDISSQNNVIIRNLRITLVGTSDPGSVNGGDDISISGTSRNIWIDHCEVFSEDPDIQTDIDLYDGLIDIKNQTGFITISWCYLHDHHKGGLVGAADDDLYSDRKITFHHNYYNKVKLRIPMYRGSIGHFYNNYIVGATDATEIRAGTCVRVEKNYYEALHYSIYTPSDSPGSTERIDNIEVSRTDRAYPSNCTADIPYDYSAELTTNTSDVKVIVPQYAGVGKI